MLILRQAVDGIPLGAAYAIAGVSFALLYRIMKVFHFAFAAIGVTGAFLAAAVGERIHGVTGVLLGLAFAMAVAGALTVLAQVAVYRPLIDRGATSGTSFVASLGLGLFIDAVLVLLLGTASRQFELDWFTRKHRAAGLPVSGLLLVSICLLLIVPAVTVWYLRRTRSGRQTEALISNPEHAQLVGIHTPLLTLAACFVAGAVSAVAFVLQGVSSGVSSAAAVPLTLFAVLAMLSGGAANVLQTAVAGLVIGVGGNIAAVTVSSDWSTVIVFVLAMSVILARPNGLVRGATAS